jgi:hypothetical protein
MNRIPSGNGSVRPAQVLGSKPRFWIESRATSAISDLYSHDISHCRPCFPPSPLTSYTHTHTHSLSLSLVICYQLTVTTQWMPTPNASQTALNYSDRDCMPAHLAPPSITSAMLSPHCPLGGTFFYFDFYFSSSSTRLSHVLKPRY